MKHTLVTSVSMEQEPRLCSAPSSSGSPGEGWAALLTRGSTLSSSFRLLAVAFPCDHMTEGPCFLLAVGGGPLWVLEAAESPLPPGPLQGLFTRLLLLKGQQESRSPDIMGSRAWWACRPSSFTYDGTRWREWQPHPSSKFYWLEAHDASSWDSWGGDDTGHWVTGGGVTLGYAYVNVPDQLRSLAYHPPPSISMWRGGRCELELARENQMLNFQGFCRPVVK